MHAGDKAHKWGVNPSLETQGRHYQKSKTGGINGSTKGLLSYNKFLKKHGICSEWNSIHGKMTTNCTQNFVMGYVGYVIPSLLKTKTP